MPFRPANLVHTDGGALVESTTSREDFGSSEPGARSSAVERCFHTADVTGSIPVAPTTPSRRYRQHLKRESEGPQRVKATLRGSGAVPLVYFVQAATLKLIKIGSTVDLKERLKTLRTGSPDRLEIIGAIRTPDACDLERRYHAHFRRDHSHGEWFRPSPELLELIAQWPLELVKRQEAADLRAALQATYA